MSLTELSDQKPQWTLGFRENNELLYNEYRKTKVTVMDGGEKERERFDVHSRMKTDTHPGFEREELDECQDFSSL